MKDANEIAKEHEVRERRSTRGDGPTKTLWGTLSVWLSQSNYVAGSRPDTQGYCTIDISKPGLLIAYDEEGGAEIWVLSDFTVFNFVPDRDAGE